QRQAGVLLRIAHETLRVPALRDRVEIVEELAPHHRDAAVAAAEVLPRAVGDAALADPRDEVLVHDVAGDPATGRLVLDRRAPGRDALLHVRVALARHAVERPGDAERVLVVDRHAPLEMVAEAEDVRPQREAARGPE